MSRLWPSVTGTATRIAVLLATAPFASARRIGWLMAFAFLATGQSRWIAAQETKRAPAAKSLAGRAELRDLARRAYDSAVLGRMAETGMTEDVYRWSRRWLDQELILAAGDPAKIVVIKEHLGRIQELTRTEFRHIDDMEYYLSEAELMLAELRPDPKFEAAVAARKALQGIWQVIRGERKGAKIEPRDWEWDTVEITGRKAVFSSTSTHGSAWGLLTLDPIAVPRRLDFFGFNEDFPFGGHGIYRLDGDQLTLCWTGKPNPPKEFATRTDDDTRLYVLKRLDRDKERQPVVVKPRE